MKMVINQWKGYLKKYDGFLKLFTANFLLRSGVVAINLGTGVLMRRELGEADSGLFGLFVGALTIFNVILNFGFNGSAMYFAKKEPEKLHLYLTTNFILTGISAIFIILALFFFSFYFQFQSNLLRTIFIVCYALYSFSLIYRSFLLGMNENVFMQKVDLATRSAYAIFFLLAYYFQCISVVAITLFMTVEYFVFTFIAHKKSDLKIWPLLWDNNFFKDNILFNSKSYLAGILYTLLLKADQFVIKFFYNNHQVGVYGIGGTIVENLFMISSIVSVIYIPRLLEKEDYLQIIQGSKKPLWLIFTSSVGMAFVIFLLSPYLYQVYFCKQNMEGATSLRVLLLGFIPLSVFIFNYYIYFSVRLKKSLLFILAFGVGLNLVLNYVYLPKYGIMASAWASSICYTLVAILSIFDLFFLKKRNYLRKSMQLDEERA